MLGRIVQNDASRDISDIEDPNIENIVAEVSCDKLETYKPKPDVDCGLTIIAYDCGMKRNIIRSFLNRGVTVVRAPWDYDLAQYKEHLDGFFCSNGPGDPKRCTATIGFLSIFPFNTWLVRSTVTVRKFVRVSTHGKREQLIAQTNTERWHVPFQGDFEAVDRCCAALWISRTVDNKWGSVTIGYRIDTMIISMI
jgi:hypothetical protein